MAQIPAVKSPYGSECRALFTPTNKDMVLIGADASGVQARLQAHYTYPFDQGKFAKLILDGDLHQENADALGLTRDKAKTWYYGWLFGAGNKKLGNIAKKNLAYGKKMREKFLKAQPALAKLVHAVQARTKERGYLLSLDKQRLPSVSEHSALNTLLQAGEAVIMKKAMVFYHQILKDVKFTQILWVHDEYQCESLPDVADEVGRAMVKGIQLAGEHFNLNIKLDGEYKIGANWKDTH